MAQRTKPKRVVFGDDGEAASAPPAPRGPEEVVGVQSAREEDEEWWAEEDEEAPPAKKKKRPTSVAAAKVLRFEVAFSAPETMAELRLCPVAAAEVFGAKERYRMPPQFAEADAQQQQKRVFFAKTAQSQNGQTPMAEAVVLARLISSPHARDHVPKSFAYGRFEGDQSNVLLVEEVPGRRIIPDDINVRFVGAAVKASTSSRLTFSSRTAEKASSTCG